jgi:hypothetical protein
MTARTIHTLALAIAAAAACYGTGAMAQVPAIYLPHDGVARKARLPTVASLVGDILVLRDR